MKLPPHRCLARKKLHTMVGRQQQQRCQQVIDGLGWGGPVYQISAINKAGVEQLCYDIMVLVEATAAAAADAEDTENLSAERDSDESN